MTDYGAGTGAGIYAREVSYLDRYVQLGIAQGRVLSVNFLTQPEPNAESDHELLDRIEAYLTGTREEFADVQVAMTMPTDQREVLEAVRTVPYGKQASVEQLARMAPSRNPDDEEDARRIREALAANPAPILIPTHRIRDGPGGAPPDVETKLRAVEGL